MAVLAADETYFADSYFNVQGVAYSAGSLSNFVVVDSSLQFAEIHLVTLEGSNYFWNAYSDVQGIRLSANALEGSDPISGAWLSDQGEIQLYANNPISESVAKSPGMLYSAFLESQKVTKNSGINREGDTHPVTSNSRLGGQGERLKESNYTAFSSKALFSGEFSYSIDQLFGNQTEDMVIISKESLLKTGLQPAISNSPENLYLAILLFSKEALKFKKDNLLPSVSIEEQGGVLITRNSKYYKQDSYTVTLRKEDTKPIIDPDDY